jgi:hypothetical protein
MSVYFVEDHFQFEEEKLKEDWKVAYKGIDIEREIKKAEAWYVANPKKRKKSHHRFLVNWLSRAKKKVVMPRPAWKQEEREFVKLSEEEVLRRLTEDPVNHLKGLKQFRGLMEKASPRLYELYLKYLPELLGKERARQIWRDHGGITLTF